LVRLILVRLFLVHSSFDSQPTPNAT